MQGLASVDTERLRLNRWDHTEHAPSLALMNADPEVVRYVGGAPLTFEQSAEMSARLEAHWDTYGYGLWAIVVKETGATVGFVGLSHPLWWPEMLERVEVGWRLARPAWGHGYATEGARAAVRYAFDTLGAELVYAQTMAVNTRSRRVLERAGLSHARTLYLEFDDPIPGTELGEVEYERRR